MKDYFTDLIFGKKPKLKRTGIKNWKKEWDNGETVFKNMTERDDTRIMVRKGPFGKWNVMVTEPPLFFIEIIKKCNTRRQAESYAKSWMKRHKNPLKYKFLKVNLPGIK